MILLCGENDEKRAIREDKEAYILLIYLLKRMNHSSSSSLSHPLIRPKPHFFSLISIHIPPNNVISPQNNPEITPNSPSANYSLSPIIPPSLPSTLTTAIPKPPRYIRLLTLLSETQKLSLYPQTHLFSETQNTSCSITSSRQKLYS